MKKYFYTILMISFFNFFAVQKLLIADNGEGSSGVLYFIRNMSFDPLYSAVGIVLLEGE